MTSRRRLIQRALAAGTLLAAPGIGRLAAQDRFDQDALLAFEPLGNVTLVHYSDLHAQVAPLYLRTAGVSYGLASDPVKEPHLTGEAFRIRYAIGGRTPMDYALTHEGFDTLARHYGKMGGLNRVATVVKAIRAERPEALLLDGGGSLPPARGARLPAPQAVARGLAALAPDAMLVGAELGAVRPFLGLFLGQDTAREADNLTDPMLATPTQNPPLNQHAVFERGGATIAVIAQALPSRTASAGQFRRDVPDILEQMVTALRANGADVVVVLAQNWFHADVKLAQLVDGIDVIFSGRSPQALPEPVLVGNTHIIASGDYGRFVSRVDLDVQNGALNGLRHKLIPIFSDLIAPDPALSGLLAETDVAQDQASFRLIGRAPELLYRRGTFQSSWDDLICAALIEQLDAQVAFVPGSRGGASVLAGETVRSEDLRSVISDLPQWASRSEMTGREIKAYLEDRAEASFAKDPFMRSGQDMVRVGGLGYQIAPDAPQGARIDKVRLLPSGQEIQADTRYVVAGIGFERVERSGLPLATVLENHFSRSGNIPEKSRGQIDVRPPA